MSARKEETPVACAAPFRRQGFGCVMSVPKYESCLYYLTGSARRLTGKIRKNSAEAKLPGARLFLV